MKTFLYSLIMLAVLSSCKKDKADAPHALVGAWTLDKVEVKPAASGDENFAIDVEGNCRLGISETFYSDGKMSLQWAAKACNNNTATESTGTWKVSNTLITFTYSQIPGEYYAKIVQIDEHTLVMTYESGEINNRTFRNTYSK